MGTYVAQGAIDYLRNLLIGSLNITYITADAITQSIADMINNATNQSVNEASSKIDAARTEILGNLDNSLNMISEWVRSEIDMVIDTFGPALTVALEQLAQAQLISQQTTLDALVQANDHVVNTQTIVEEQLSNAITLTGESIKENQELVKESLEEQSKSIFDNVNDILGKILDLPQKLIDQAISYLIPAQASAWLDKITHLIISDPVSGLVRYAANQIGAIFENMLDFDEKEVLNLLTKFSGVFDQYTQGMMKTSMERG